MEKTYDNAAIYVTIAEEEESGIPGKGVERFKFKGSSSWDTDGWYFKNDDHDYLYLDREGGYHVTIQRCNMINFSGKEKHYWNVYIEKDITDEDSVKANQTVAHTFRWVRTLKHAMYLGEVSNEIALGLACPENFFLTKEEWDTEY